MNIPDLRHQQASVDHINILSFEGDIYLAEADFSDHRDIVQNSDGSPMRFSSISQLKETLLGAGFSNFQLVFDSPYDNEMC